MKQRCAGGMKTGLYLLLFLLPLSVFSQNITADLEVAYTQANLLPQFPGGIKAFKELMATCEYPDESIDRDEEGTVMLSFIVGETGEIGNVKVLKTSGFKELDRCAWEQVSEQPDWIPGFKYGAAVPVTYFVALHFALEDDPVDSRNR